MDEILSQDFQKNYYMTIRQFTGGAVEAVVRAVKPLRAESIDASIKGCLTRSMEDVRKRSAEEIDEWERNANHRRAVRRAKQHIRWLVKQMVADRLFTLTYRENVEDRERVKADFKEFLRLVRKQYPDWQYVAVLEKQDRGAFHIHCAVKGWQRIQFLRKCWYQALGGCGNETGADTPGSVNITSPARRWGSGGREWKTDKLASYIVKYLEKTFSESTAEKRRYWHSRDIKAPVPERMYCGGVDAPSAIWECVKTLQFGYGLRSGFAHWLSDDYCSYWIAGMGGAE